VDLSGRARECEFFISPSDLEVCSLDFINMSPSRVETSSRARRNTQSSSWVPQTRTRGMPTVLDVDEIHTPEYEPTMMHVEEEKNPAQEVEQPKEDVERTESDTSKGKGM
jgi:hypothetical protein